MQIYILMINQNQQKHSKCLNLLKLKHNIKLLVYEHFQVKQSKNCDLNLKRLLICSNRKSHQV